MEQAQVNQTIRREKGMHAEDDRQMYRRQPIKTMNKTDSNSWDRERAGMRGILGRWAGRLVGRQALRVTVSG